VLGLFGEADKPSSFMIVNRDYQHDSEAVLKSVLTGSQIEELDRETGQWSKASGMEQGREWKIKLQPGDGRLFRVLNPR